MNACAWAARSSSVGADLRVRVVPAATKPRDLDQARIRRWADRRVPVEHQPPRPLGAVPAATDRDRDLDSLLAELDEDGICVFWG